jgi:hypothetical protein
MPIAEYSLGEGDGMPENIEDEDRLERNGGIFLGNR